jgi:hypothetical protein
MAKRTDATPAPKHATRGATNCVPCVVIVGAVVAIPAFRWFLHAGGWAAVRHQVKRASGVTVITVPGWAALIALSNSLSVVQRNGNDVAYGLAAVLYALLTAATLGLWTAAAVAVERRLMLTPLALASEAICAAVVTAAMMSMTAATAIWWAAMATTAPWFLHGGAPGSPGSSFEPRVAITLMLMITCVLAASYGTIRAARSLRLHHAQ